ncbi:MAG: hypothetical protein JXA82_04065 [Sedimentisphaerales bacterium]|nr:hypothetical protein [Sedimentisphaerales bacterium]
MKTNNMSLECLVQDLLEILEAEQRRIAHTLTRLDELRSAVIKRDENMLFTLQETIRTEQEQAVDLESRRELVREKIAGILGCSVEKLNLTRLCRSLDGAPLQKVHAIQRSLKESVRALKNEHYVTTVLLRDCARINHALLRCLLGERGQTRLYNARGTSALHLERGLMSLKA